MYMNATWGKSPPKFFPMCEPRQWMWLQILPAVRLLLFISWNVHKWCLILEGAVYIDLKNWTLEGDNRTLGGEGGQKWPNKIGHHLWMFPLLFFNDTLQVKVGLFSLARGINSDSPVCKGTRTFLLFSRIAVEITLIRCNELQGWIFSISKMTLNRISN